MLKFTRIFRQFKTGDPAPAGYDPGLIATMIERGTLRDDEPTKQLRVVPADKMIRGGAATKRKGNRR